MTRGWLSPHLEVINRVLPTELKLIVQWFCLSISVITQSCMFILHKSLLCRTLINLLQNMLNDMLQV